jgi:hypothetical protein
MSKFRALPLAPEVGALRRAEVNDHYWKLELSVVLLLCAIAWALSHGYRGIFHDAGLYTLEALAHRDPSSLGQDVFLRLGSQARFTIFGSIYAAAIRLLGTETAAATLTLTCQMAVCACAWLLARAVMPARLALYGVAVLIAIPGDYGADRIFTCLEPFLTPRMGAEALTLAALAAALRARTPVAWGLILLAALIHPLMACAGIAALLLINVALPYPRLSLTLTVAGAAALLAGAFAMPTGVWGRFDADWLQLVMDRSPYLFVLNWQPDDWARATVTLATLIVGLYTATGPQARSLCRAALFTTAAGLLLTFIACDELHLVLVTQIQPWRWQWLGTVTAALLLPLIVRTRWQTDVIGRATVLLLVAAWIFAANEFAVVAALAALVSLALARRLTPSEARLVLSGACGLLAIAIVWRIASNLEFTDSHYIEVSVPSWWRRASSFAHDGTALAAVLVITAWLADARRGRPALVMLIALAATACAALFPATWTQWTIREYRERQIAQFAPWRVLIPAGANVFWAGSPVGAWILLDRPNYLSVLQTSGMVFSRPTAIELERRANTLASVVPPGSFLNFGAGSNLQLTTRQLVDVCQLGAFVFLVTNADLGVTPAGFIPSESPSGSKGLRLYQCPIQRN